MEAGGVVKFPPPTLPRHPPLAPASGPGPGPGPASVHLDTGAGSPSGAGVETCCQPWVEVPGLGA